MRRIGTLAMAAVMLLAGAALAGEIHDAARQGDLAKVKALLDKDPKLVNERDFYQLTPLFHAVPKGHLEMCKLLIEKGADVKATDDIDATPLHNAAALGHIEICKLLLDKGADVNARDKWGVTPLHLAASNGHLPVCELLIARGADAKAADNNGLTVLHWAAMEGSKAICELLLAKGADVNAKTKDGWAPIDMALDKDTIELLKAKGGKDDPKKRTEFFWQHYPAEAKTNLAALFTAQVSYFGENNKYGTTFKDLGWEPEGKTKYALFLANDVLQPKVGGPYQLPAGITAEVTANGFTIVAVGNIDDDDTLDVWTINEKKELKNLTNDAEK